MDEYDNERCCLIKDIFKNNKLEYIYIYNVGYRYARMLLMYNIENLRYFSTDYIKLGISCCWNNVNSLYDLFLKKYIDQEQSY